MLELLLAVYHPARTSVNVKTYKIRRSPAEKFFGDRKTGVHMDARQLVEKAVQTWTTERKIV